MVSRCPLRSECTGPGGLSCPGSSPAHKCHLASSRIHRPLAVPLEANANRRTPRKAEELEAPAQRGLRNDGSYELSKRHHAPPGQLARVFCSDFRVHGLSPERMGGASGRTGLPFHSAVGRAHEDPGQTGGGERPGPRAKGCTPSRRCVLASGEQSFSARLTEAT